MEIKIDKLNVDENGLTQLVELLGRTAPTQFVREFVKNSDEAIQRLQPLNPTDLLQANGGC